MTQSRDEMIAEVQAGLASGKAGPVALARLMIRRYGLDIEDPLLQRRTMDPDVALSQMRILTAQTLADGDVEPWTSEHVQQMAIASIELAEAVQALDGWLSSGGFFPAAWSETGERGAT